MRRQLAHILRSERGASLIAALFLLLVCSVVASVVLAAGSAATGRLSQLAALDQRYYNVTSAVELFQDCLGNGKAVVTQKREESYTTTTVTETIDGVDVTYVILEGPIYSYGAANSLSVTSAAPISADSASAILGSLTRLLIFADSSAVTTSSEASWNRQRNWSGTTATSLNFTIKPSGNPPINANSLTVNVTGYMAADGTTTLTFTSKSTSSNNDKYRLALTLRPEVSSSIFSTSGSTQELSTTVTWQATGVEMV